jgi:hypothetical protein
MRSVASIIAVFVLLAGFIQVACGEVQSGDLRDIKAAILTLRSTESFDFRVASIEFDDIFLDTVTTIQSNDHPLIPEFTNGGKLLFTPTSIFSSVTAGTIDMELMAYNGTVANVNLNAGHSIEFEPYSFTITASPTNAGSISVFIDVAEFFVKPGERKQIVSIDIAPISPPDSINANAYDVIPVVIYGSANLDVSRIDLDSLLLTAHDFKIVKTISNMAVIDNINNDGYPDLVVAFRNIDNGFSSNRSSAMLKGNLSDGTTIGGIAHVSIAQ